MGGQDCQLSRGCVEDGRAPSGEGTSFIKPMPAQPSSVPLQLVNLNQLALMALNSDKYHATYDKETHNVTNIKNIENDTTNVHEILNGHIVKGSQFTQRNNVNDGIQDFKIILLL